MIGNKEHVQRIRLELIEVITSVTREKRLEGSDVQSIEQSLRAHMCRLSELDGELAAPDLPLNFHPLR